MGRGMVLVGVITIIEQLLEPTGQLIVEMFSQLTVEAWIILVISLAFLIVTQKWVEKFIR